SDGSYVIHSALSIYENNKTDYVLDVLGGKDTNAATLCIWPKTGYSNQSFELLTVAEAVAKFPTPQRNLPNGIDVSSWQPADIGWRVDYDFMIVKATGATWYRNPNLSAQASAALSRGKKLGLYHFAQESDTNNSAIAEADWFISNIGSYLGKAVLFLDYERDLPGTDSTWITQFCQRVKARTGISCQIYASGNWAKNYINGLWTQLGVWLWQANYSYGYAPFYGYNPTGTYMVTPQQGMMIHQYTSSGYLTGYSKALDLDVLYGSYADWDYRCKT
ncbi:MAG: hypothetical protein LBU07_05895, partial [Coriobacteriales bacterium]|nr:hypothetical protein [Coriobacteriales bacterium]